MITRFKIFEGNLFKKYIIFDNPDAIVIFEIVNEAPFTSNIKPGDNYYIDDITLNVLYKYDKDTKELKKK